MVQIEITVGQGLSRIVQIDPEELTLGFLEDMEEAQANGKWSALIPVFATMLGLTRDELRNVTVRQFKAIGEALQAAGKAAGTIPNENG